jgi:RNA polymerase sigma-70 factor (ECF subfamily)
MKSDVDLVQRIKQGDRDAVAELYTRYLPYVWRYVHARLPGDSEASRDVVSETFLAAIKDISRFDERVGAVSAWLTGIIRHKLSDVRQHKRQAVDLDASMVCAKGESDPSTTNEAAETRKRVICALHELPDEARLLLELKYLDDLSVKEIADHLGQTEKTVEAQLYRARRRFRDRWAAFDDRFRQEETCHEPN